MNFFSNEIQTLRNWAMYYALQHEINKAITHLQKAIALGFDNVEWLKTDDNMNGLRKKSAFREMVGQLEKNSIR